MRILLLSLGAALLPCLWGWFIYRLLRRLWPEPEVEDRAHAAADQPGSLIDYQI